MKTNISFDPRNMWFVINYNTVRRTSEDVYDLPGIDESDLYPAIGMKGDQRKLYDHIVTQRKIGWLNQAQKALLDPRMVDPEILKELDLLGKFKIEDSVKYKRLMKYILEKDKGELEAGEKFVVFSSEYAQGVTRENKDLKAVYEKMEEGEEREENEKMKEWKSSELDVTLADYIQKKVADVYGKKIGVIDGQLGLDEKLAVNDMLANDDDCIGVLCTTEAGGESLDYSRASFCYVLDDCFIPEEMDQAISRVDRKGQIHPVKLRYLFVDETLDDQKHAYVNVKRIINSIAMDGEPLTEEEIEILNDTKNTTLTYMIMKSLGGISIDTSQAEIEDTNAFSTKVRRKSKATKAKGRRKSIVYETTDAQKILSRIGRDPGCWFDEDFAVYYTEHLHELSVYPVHSAKVVDLVKRAATGDIEFPGRVLSDGAGPSILYSVYETLENVVSDNGFSVPEIVERDYSENMLILGDNNEQVIGNMTGEDSSFSDGEFDMVDNSSITLLENSEDALKTLKEAHRVTRMGGLLHLRTKGWRFTDGFYKALKKLGYELLSKKNEGFALTAAFKRKLKGSHGDHYAEAYAAQFSGTYRILARKVSDSCEDVDEDVWFEQEIPERTETLVDLITNGQEENVDVDIRPGEPDLESGTRFIVGQDGVVERVVRSEDVEVDEEE